MLNGISLFIESDLSGLFILEKMSATKEINTISESATNTLKMVKLINMILHCRLRLINLEII